ncbi:MAG: amidohydrolase family protein [Alphaproteobacteria bacterium]|nr:amidohydrolase family protein [Alphaproteobacteria bacterium]
MTRLKVVDAHHHLWDLARNKHPWLQGERIPFRYGDYGAICRTYLPDDYRRDSASFDVIGSVHMEAEHDPADPVRETRWLHEVAERYGIPSGIVGAAFLDRDDADSVLAGHAAFPLVRSIRHKPRSAPAPDMVVPGAPGSMGDPRWRAGYRLLSKRRLSFDLQTPWWHLPEAAQLARDFPDTPIILNHTGLPSDRSAQGLAGWRAAMERFAAEPNALAKISGIGQPGKPWTVEANGPIVRDVIRIFGVDRCMFASNFPVDSVCATFDEIFGGFRAIVADMTAGDQAKLFRDNAIRHYRLTI